MEQTLYAGGSSSSDSLKRFSKQAVQRSNLVTGSPRNGNLIQLMNMLKFAIWIENTLMVIITLFRRV
ncbi:Uncharacterised protein [Actinobacillus equuli]|nr:Uncharacterised protein [Actinobacillus equuli]